MPQIHIVNPHWGLDEIIGNTISQVTVLLAIIAFGAFVWGGLQLIMSEGDPKKVESGRNTLLYSFFGMIIIVFSYWIVYYLSKNLI